MQKVIHNCDTLDEWSSDFGSLSLDLVDKQEGLACVVDTIGDVYANWTRLVKASPEDLTPYRFLRFWFKTQDASKTHILMLRNDYQNYAEWNLRLKASNAWNLVEVDLLNPTTVTGNFNLAAVRDFIFSTVTEHAYPFTIKIDNIIADTESQVVPVLRILPTLNGTTDPPPGDYSPIPATVTAIPNAGYVLDYWLLDGANAGSANPISLEGLTGEHELQAVFKPAALQKFVETDFSTGTLSPFTPEWLEGTYEFFTPTTDPLGTGSYGVIFKGGRIAGRYTFLKGLGLIRATVTVAFPDTALGGCFLILRSKAMLGTGNFLFWLDVWSNRWRTIYFNNGEMVMGDYPAIGAPQPNRKYNVTLELKMGTGDGRASLYIDNNLVWERTGLNNVSTGPIELIEVGLPLYLEEGAITYIYYTLVEGVVMPTYTLSGYVKDSAGKPLQNAVVAIGMGEMDPTRPDKGVIHTPIATALTDNSGYYSTTVPEGTYLVEAFKGPGEYDRWIRNGQGRVLDYAEKIKHEVRLTSDLRMDFTLNQTLAPQPTTPPPKSYYWPERSVWVFPYAWGGYSRRDGTATPKPEVVECLNDLKTQIPNINTIDVRLSLAPHPTVPDMPIISEDGHPVTMEDIEAITKAAHERGLRVHLSLVGYGGIAVTNPATWFQNYLRLLLNPTSQQRASGQTEGLIPFAIRLGIEEFTLGWEFWFARREFEEGEWNNYWSNVVDQVRAAGYKGKLAYHFQTINDPNGYWGPPVDKFCSLNTWIKKLDFILMSDFHIQTFYPYDVDASYDEALQTWMQHPDFMEGYGTIPILRTVYQTFNVPIAVNFGFRLRWGCPRTYGVPDLPKDEHENALLYLAAFHALRNEPWCCGVNLEHFDAPYDPANPTSCIRGEYSTVIINTELASHIMLLATLSGVIKDEMGNPIVGAVVTCDGYTDVTEIDGKYIFSDIPAQPYTLKVTKEGYQTQTVPVDLSAGGTYTLDITLYSAPTPTHTLTIIARAGGTTNPSPGTYTIAEGKQQQVTAIPDTNYRFANWLLDGVSRTENPITVTMDADHTLEAVFEYVPPPPLTATISGIVKDPAGNPIAGATVTCDGYADVTEIDGKYIFPDIPAQKYTLTATKEGYQTQTVQVDLSAGGTFVLDIVLQPAVTPPPTPQYELHTLLWIFARKYLKGVTAITGAPLIDYYDKMMTSRGWGIQVKVEGA